MTFEQAVRGRPRTASGSRPPVYLRVMPKAALLLLVGSAFAVESPVRSERERDALWSRDSIAESDAQFGLADHVASGGGTDESPTGHNVDLDR